MPDAATTQPDPSSATDSPSAPVAEKPGPGGKPTTLAPLHLRLFAILFDYAVIVASVKLAEQIFLGEHWDLQPMVAAVGWRAFVTPWQGAMLVLLLARDVLGSGIGKSLTGIVIRRGDDPTRSASFVARVLRNVSLVIFPVDAWLVFRDPFGRRLGDRLAGTVVVLNPRPRDIFQRAMGLGILFLGLVLGALLVTSWNLHRSAAFQTAYTVATQDVGLAQQIGSNPIVEKSPELELRLPGLPSFRDFTPPPMQSSGASDAIPPDALGTAIAIFDATGPTGKAKLRVEMTLLPATVTEPAHWQVTHTEVLDALGGTLKQKDAPKK
jgi:hypothetical protein